VKSPERLAHDTWATRGKSSETLAKLLDKYEKPKQIEYPLQPPMAPPRSAQAIIADHCKPIDHVLPDYLPAKPQVQELIAAIKGESLVRRSNACGAIKVLASHKQNQVILARTEGLIEALVFATGDAISANTRTLIRATSALQLLATLKENRRFLCEQANLLTCLVKVMNGNANEARAISSRTVALLAKSEENRNRLVNVEGLVTTLCNVVRGDCDEDGFLIRNACAAKFLAPILRDTEYSSSLASESERNAVRPSISLSHSPQENSSKASELDQDCRNHSSSRSTFLTRGNRDRSSVVEIKSNLITHATANKFMQSARINACAALLHFCKHCPISVRF